MTVFLIILAILILIMLLPVGADAAYGEGILSLRIKLGIIKIKLFPRKKKELSDAKRAKLLAKKEKKKAQRLAKKEAKANKKAETEEDKEKKRGLTREDIIEIIKLGLDTLARFRKSISIDILHLHILITSDDPFDCVKKYGYLNALLGALLPILHRAFKIRDEDIKTGFQMSDEPMQIDARLAITIRIWEIFFIAICALVGFIKWNRRRKKQLIQSPS